MPVQLTYDQYYNEALEGMKADMEAYNTVSKLNKGDAVIPFGRAVFSDGDDGMRLPTNGDNINNFIGITMRELTRVYTDAAIAGAGGIGAVPNYDSTVMTMGVIWVNPAVDVVKDNPVFIIKADGTFTNAAGADAATTIQVPNAKYVSSVNAQGLAKISLVVGG